MSSIALITAVYGGYDSLNLREDHGFDDAVLVSDVPAEVPPTWRVIVEPQEGTHPRLAAKQAKFLPWLYTECDSSVWMDGGFSVHGDLRSLADRRLAADDLCVCDHPDQRSSYYEEAVFSTRVGKYLGLPLIEQAEHYRSEGVPDPSGLWALGMIARRHTDMVQDFGIAWLKENIRWTVQDQGSFPYLVWRLEKSLTTWGLPLRSNSIWMHKGHLRSD
jgi:hypothetical protein